jgi:hypothetical protein
MELFSFCKRRVLACHAVFYFVTLLFRLAAAEEAFSVLVREDVQGSDLEKLWSDYGLGLNEPRHVYQAFNNYLVVMNQRKAGRLNRDVRIISVTDVAEDQSDERANKAPIIVDHWFRNRCSIPNNGGIAFSGSDANEPLDEFVLLTVATSRMFDPHGPSTQNLKKSLESFYIQHLRDTIVIESDSDRMFRMRILSNHTCAVYSRLLRDKEVVFIEKSQKMTALSNYASSVGQSGSKFVISDSNALIWKQGLMGQGHVIGLGDTGIDIDSCFYRESATTAPGIVGCDLNRHKIACYFTSASGPYGDTPTAFGGGHGSLVAGILAGYFSGLLHSGDDWNVSYSDVISDGSIPNGMAPLARIAVNDISGAQGGLITPTDFSSDPYFSNPYNQAQVRVHSNSWGCEYRVGYARDCNTYAADTRSVDEFLWNNKDFLVLFAAGNSGQAAEMNSATYADGYYTVVGPATAKNVLSIGATYQNGPFNHDCGVLQRPCTSDDLMQDSSRGPTFDGRIKPDLVFPGASILGPFSSGNATDFSDGATCASRVLSDATTRGTGTVRLQMQTIINSGPLSASR